MKNESPDKLAVTIKLTVFCLWCTITCSATDLVAQDFQTVNLNVELSFPKPNDEVILAGPSDMDMDENGTIYICDVVLCQILKFSPTGEFMGTIGKQGQGPGEFQGLYRFTYSRGKVYLNDQAHRRVQIMSAEGEFLDAFKVFAIPSELVAHEGQIFTSDIYRQTPDADGRLNLIAVLNEKGRRIAAFGEFLDHGQKNLSKSVSKCLLKIHDNRLYTLFVHYPLLRVYTLDGELEKSLAFEGMHYEKRIPQNYEWDKFREGRRVLPFRFLFRAFDVNSAGVFVALYTPDDGLTIDHFSHEGRFLKRYFKKKKEKDDYSLRDLIVVQTPGESKLTFFVLHEDGLPIIDVLTE